MKRGEVELSQSAEQNGEGGMWKIGDTFRLRFRRLSLFLVVEHYGLRGAARGMLYSCLKT
jgi:hypothetical protein